ncbi:GNAT family N-acetyltransferase [Thalassiella azotivora]
MTIRPAEPRDVPAIDALVRELAVYEREPDAVQATPADFERALFGPDPRVHCHVAEDGAGEHAQVVGMALWYVTFSTWRGRHGIWLEDLFVRPPHRGQGTGRRLLAALAAEARDRGYARLEWWVLDWNEPAHGFYRGIGATPQDEWTVWRLDDEALPALADLADARPVDPADATRPTDPADPADA